MRQPGGGIQKFLMRMLDRMQWHAGTARKKGGQMGYLLTATRQGGKAMRSLRGASTKEVWAEDS